MTATTSTELDHSLWSPSLDGTEIQRRAPAPTGRRFVDGRCAIKRLQWLVLLGCVLGSTTACVVDECNAEARVDQLPVVQGNATLDAQIDDGLSVLTGVRPDANANQKLEYLYGNTSLGIYQVNAVVVGLIAEAAASPDGLLPETCNAMCQGETNWDIFTGCSATSPSASVMPIAGQETGLYCIGEDRPECISGN